MDFPKHRLYITLLPSFLHTNLDIHLNSFMICKSESPNKEALLVDTNTELKQSRCLHGADRWMGGADKNTAVKPQCDQCQGRERHRLLKGTQIRQSYCVLGKEAGQCVCVWVCTCCECVPMNVSISVRGCASECVSLRACVCVWARVCPHEYVRLYEWECLCTWM